MNKTEQRFAQYLEGLRLSGSIARWDFEPEKLRMADKTWYAPDFRVVGNSGEIVFYEVKGFWRDDARIKVKVCATLHPYRFIAVSRDGSDWKLEEFSSA